MVAWTRAWGSEEEMRERGKVFRIMMVWGLLEDREQF